MSSRSSEVGKHLERFLQDLKHHLPQLDAELQLIKELQKESDTKALKDAQEENKKLAKENKDLKRKLGALTAETRKSENDEAKNKELSKEIEKWKRQFEETESLVKDRFKGEIEELVAEKRKLEEKCDKRKHKINSLKTKVNEAENKEKDWEQLESKYKKVRNKLDDTVKELEETKLRLSELMGHQLSDKNPNIADLSDQHRPTKLGEMFSGLYDDEYTDAFEEINTGNDKQTCQKLLDLLMDAKRFCADKAEAQLRALKSECIGNDTMSTSTDTSLVDYSLKEMKDVRKKNAKKALEGVYDKFVNHMTYSRYSTIFTEPHRYSKTIAFARKCVELCWLMAVQDPPLAFGPLPQHRDRYNADMYREYTRSGTLVDFAVWPVLQLYENGPVLSKGVVEPIKDGWRDNRTETRSYGTIDRDHYFVTDYRRHDRDLDVDESSRPISDIGTYSTQREVDSFFDTERPRVGGLSRRYFTDRDYPTTSDSRHTSSVGYQLTTTSVSRNRHSPQKYGSSASRPYSAALHEKGWRY